MHLKAGDEVYRSLYVFRNLVMVMQNSRVLREMELKNPSDCLSYRVVAKSIERVANHACMQYNPQSNQTKRQDSEGIPLKDGENE
jgi:hypothetical protein